MGRVFGSHKEANALNRAIAFRLGGQSPAARGSRQQGKTSENAASTAAFPTTRVHSNGPVNDRLGSFEFILKLTHCSTLAVNHSRENEHTALCKEQEDRAAREWTAEGQQTANVVQHMVKCSDGTISAASCGNAKQ
ncbi:hypothetical protein AOLI_G00330840 [Acnodon oligacanthus]